MPKTGIRELYNKRPRNRTRRASLATADARKRIHKRRARASKATVARKRINKGRLRASKTPADAEKRVESAHRKSPVKVEIGSGNVFADIGLPNPEEALAKAEIARRLNLALSSRKLSQVEAGAVLGIPQPRVCDLARGRLGKFSLEKLIDFAKRLGNDVEIRIQPSRKTPRLKVMTAKRVA